MASLKRDLATLSERIDEARDLLTQLDEHLSGLRTKEAEVFAACGGREPRGIREKTGRQKGVR